MVGAIRYLTKKDLAELRTSSDKEQLSIEVANAAAAERALLRALVDSLEFRYAKVKLTKEGKAALKPYFAEIEILYSLRNRGYAEELAKLKLLKPKTKSSDYELVFSFRKTSEGKFVIKSIKFEKIEEAKPVTSDPDVFN